MELIPEKSWSMDSKRVLIAGLAKVYSKSLNIFL